MITLFGEEPYDCPDNRSLTVAAPMRNMVLQSRDREGAVPGDYKILRDPHDADH
jgi:hypothetical protein